MLAERQIEEYAEHMREIGKSHHTIRLYCQDLREFAQVIEVPLWPKPSGFDQLMTKWIERRRNLGDSVSSIRRRLFSIKSFYTYAGIPQITSKIKIPKLRKYLPKVLSLKETNKLLDQIGLLCYETFIFASLVLLTGLKIDELYTLKATDEGLETSKLRVYEANSSRIVIVGKEAMIFILDFYRNGNSWKKSKADILNTLHVASALTNCPDATPHNLRSTCAARMLAAGYPKEFVRVNLGYQSNHTLNLITKVMSDVEDSVF